MKSDAIALVIFGVTGDLTKRKLLPAIYQLNMEGRLDSPIDVIGFARRPWDEQLMQKELKQGIEKFARVKPVQSQKIDELLINSKYFQYSFDDPTGYEELYAYLQKKGYRKTIFYLATPPQSYQQIIKNLPACKNLSNKSDWMRIVVEKPYGEDLSSARNLEELLHKCFKEEQIFRIDHYLGKETVQNILVFRFANGIFEPLWNSHYIDHVQITVSENIGIGSRAGYFDQTGVVRDMFANHMLQLLSLTAMEAPYAFNADSVRDEKMKVLRSLRSIKGKDATKMTVRGQYSGNHIDGMMVKGYLEEHRVALESTTETYLSVKVHIDNWRWAGVPFYLRSGKMLPIRATEIAIQFRQIPLSLFDWKNMAGKAPNILILRLQPDEGIHLTFGAKMPGPTNEIAPVGMEFCYEETFGAEPPEAYERLLLDCVMGDQTLFTRTDEVIEQWRFVDGILNAWKKYPVRSLPQYPAGTWGPGEAEDFIRADQREWHQP